MSNNRPRAQKLESFHLEVKKPGFFSGLLRRVIGSPQETVNPQQGRTSPTLSEASIESDSTTESRSSMSLMDMENPNLIGWRKDTSPINLVRRIRRINNSGINKEYWMKDEKVKECYDCKCSFTTFRRRHHCRICGQIFCHKCASSVVSGKKFGYDRDIRVCNFCLQIMDSYDNDNGSIAGSIDSPSRIRSSSVTFTPFLGEGIQLSRTPSASSDIQDSQSLDLRKMLTNTFFRTSIDVGENIPFRSAVDPIADEQVNYDDPDEPNNSESFSIPDVWLPSPFLDLASIPVNLNFQSEILERETSRKQRISKYTGFNTYPRPKFTKFNRFLSNTRLAGENEVDFRYRSFSSALNLDLNAASIAHMQRLMQQMLELSEITDIPEWKDIIMKMLLKICVDTKPDVRSGDGIDIRTYVKIKKIPAGFISDSLYLSGVVATLCPIHKQMLDSIENPKILLLTFPLQYQRIENEFTSLDPIIVQENDYVTNLSLRLAALEPDIILVEKSVSGIAFEIFLKYNITVLQNVKHSLLEKVARLTETDIIHSMDKLVTNPKLGTCKKLYFRTFINPDIKDFRKTYMFLEGCDSSKGCTLLLRGETEEKLKKVKKIVSLMVSIVYNLKLETCLLKDEYARTPSVNVLPEIESIRDIKSMKGDPTKRAMKLFQNIILSGSPDVKYPPPYLLLKLRDQEQGLMLSNNAMPLAPMQVKSNASDLETKLTDNPEVNNEGDKTIPLVKAPSSLESRYVISTADSISPFTQQNIMVLFSNSCFGNVKPCLPPQSHLIEFYGESDLTLGQFVEDTCFGSKFKCPSKSCEKSMIDHHRIYAHYQGKLVVSVESMKCPVDGMDDKILMWSKCKLCGETTPYIPMSEETWKISFGKYLELTFYHSDVLVRASTCKHDIHRQHDRFFAFSNITLRIEYQEILLFEICIPPMRRQVNSLVIEQLRKTDSEALRHQISEFYDSVIDRVEAFVYEIVPAHKQQAAKDTLIELGKKAGSEKKFMMQLLQQTLISSDPLDSIALNMVYKSLLEKIAHWESEFSEFIRNYLQTESRDLRKTAAQLRKMVFDRDEKVVSTITSGVIRDVESDTQVLIKFDQPILGSSPSMYPKVEDERIMYNADVSENIRRFSMAILTEEDECFLPEIGNSPGSSGLVHPSNTPKSVISWIGQKSDEKDLISVDSVDLDNDFMYPRDIDVSLNKGIFNTTQSQGLADSDDAVGDDSLNAFTGVAAESEHQKLFASHRTPGERASIMQTISNLWNGNPANFLPLIDPSNPREHVFSDSLVIVREDEPTSIIAFTLSSVHYKEKLAEMRQDDPVYSPTESENPRYSIDFDDQNGDAEEPLLRGAGTHIRYQFWDGNSRMNCKVFFAEQFDALRRNCGVDEVFEQSLARCVKWETSGGKSGSFFMKTRDNWLVIKQLTRLEMDALYKFAPAYFEYMSQAFFHELPTILAKIFGFYRIGFKNPATGKTMKMDLLVMENLFYERNISRIFDLKGSVRNRHVQSTGKENEVLLDENLLEFIHGESPLFIREHSKKVLRASVWNDTLFLSKLNVMDYSLLVGIDSDSNELVIGIVDFIRTFTWDKKLESWVKETGILGGGGREPTIVTPRQYKNRFRESMEAYFIMVPDKFVDQSFK